MFYDSTSYTFDLECKIKNNLKFIIMSIKEKKETIKILVTAEIEYDANDPGSRKEAIQEACKNATGINTYGYPITVKLGKAKEIKK